MGGIASADTRLAELKPGKVWSGDFNMVGPDLATVGIVKIKDQNGASSAAIIIDFDTKVIVRGDEETQGEGGAEIGAKLYALSVGAGKKAARRTQQLEERTHNVRFTVPVALPTSD